MSFYFFLHFFHHLFLVTVSQAIPPTSEDTGENIMKKKMFIEVIEPKSIALSKKQDKWVITYVERDFSGDNRQERMFWVDVKINPPRDKFIIVRYELSKGKDGDYFKFIAFEDPQQLFGKNKTDGGVK